MRLNDVQTRAEFDLFCQTWLLEMFGIIRMLGESATQSVDAALGTRRPSVCLPTGWKRGLTGYQQKALRRLHNDGFDYTTSLVGSIDAHCDAMERCVQGKMLLTPVATAARAAVEVAATIRWLEDPSLDAWERACRYAARLYASYREVDRKYKSIPIPAGMPTPDRAGDLVALAVEAGLSTRTTDDGEVTGFTTPAGGYTASTSLDKSALVEHYAPGFSSPGGAYRYLCDFTHGNAIALRLVHDAQSGNDSHYRSIVLLTKCTHGVAGIVPAALRDTLARLGVPPSHVEECSKVLDGYVADGYDLAENLRSLLPARLPSAPNFAIVARQGKKDPRMR